MNVISLLVSWGGANRQSVSVPIMIVSYKLILLTVLLQVTLYIGIVLAAQFTLEVR